MLRDLVNDGGYVALRLVAEEREGWMDTQRKDVKNLLYSRRPLMMGIDDTTNVSYDDIGNQTLVRVHHHSWTLKVFQLSAQHVGSTPVSTGELSPSCKLDG